MVIKFFYIDLSTSYLVFLIHIFASSNLHRLRDFIKHVYVDRKYTGEKTGIVELPALRLVSSALLYMQAHGSYPYFKISFLCCGKLVQK